MFLRDQCDAAKTGLARTVEKRDRLCAVLDGQVAEARRSYNEARRELDVARRRAAAYKET